MTRIFTEGFEMGDFGSWDYASSASIYNHSQRSGAYSGGDIYGDGTIQKTLDSLTELYCRVACRYRYWTNYYFSDASLVNDLIRVKLERNVVPVLYIGGVSVATGTQIFPENTGWQVYEVYVKIHDTEGQVILKINGTEDINYTGDTKPDGATSINNFRLTINNGTWDDIALNDTTGTEDNSWCGDGRIIRMAPNGNGDNSDFKGSDGDYTNNYLLVDDRPYDTGTFVVGENVGDYDLYNFAASGLPEEQIIKRVWVEATAKDPEAGDVSLLVKSGTTLSEDSADQTLGSSYRRIRSDDYTTNPDTGAEWSEAELDAIQAGMKVKS